MQGTNFSRSFHFIFLMKNRGDDATENVNFQRGKQRLQGAKISSSILMSFSMKDRGTMRQKMSIFKGGNSVCRGPKIFQGCEIFKLNFDDFFNER